MRKCMDAANLHRRLAKIIGQVQAIDRMIDEDVHCDGIQHGDADKTIESFTKAVERFSNMS